MKRYQFNHPSRERCQALGIKMVGLHARFHNWLAGISWCCEATGKSNAFHLTMVKSFTFTVDAADEELVKKVEERLGQYGYEMVKIPEFLSDFHERDWRKGGVI